MEFFQVFHILSTPWTLIITAFILWILPKFLRYRRLQKMMSVIPGPKIPGFIGDAKLILSQNLPTSASMSNAMMSAIPELYRPKSGIASFWLTAMVPVVVVFKAKAIEDLLTSTVMINKPPEYKLLRALLGNGLVTSNEDVWRKHRKILTPAFHFRILEEFKPIINSYAKKLLRLFEDKCDSSWIDISPLIHECALHIICETSMGFRLDDDPSAGKDYVHAVPFFLEQGMKRVAKPWLRPNWIYYLTPDGQKSLRCVRIAKSFVSQVIKQRKEQLLKKCHEEANNKELSLTENDDPKPKRHLALLDLLLQYHMEDGKLTEEDVRSHVETFMFAGHDTSTYGTTWCLHLLGLNPEAQSKVHQELDEAFDPDHNGNIKNEDLKKLKYLEWTIKETLRLRPPAPLIARNITEDIKLDQHVVPAGSVCWISIYGAHMDPKVFPEPQKFIPERFSPEQSKGRSPFAYVPFSAGQRNCIGQRFAMSEMKIILATILRKFQVVSLDQQDKVHIDASVTFNPVDPIRMMMIRR